MPEREASGTEGLVGRNKRTLVSHQPCLDSERAELRGSKTLRGEAKA